jgi:hypothetical protein
MQSLLELASNQLIDAGTRPVFGHPRQHGFYPSFLGSRNTNVLPGFESRIVEESVKAVGHVARPSLPFTSWNISTLPLPMPASSLPTQSRQALSAGPTRAASPVSTAIPIVRAQSDPATNFAYFVRGSSWSTPPPMSRDAGTNTLADQLIHGPMSVIAQDLDYSTSVPLRAARELDLLLHAGAEAAGPTTLANLSTSSQAAAITGTASGWTTSDNSQAQCEGLVLSPSTLESELEAVLLSESLQNTGERQHNINPRQIR